MDDVNCVGTERRLYDCSHISSHNCDHSEDASVLCLRLIINPRHAYAATVASTALCFTVSSTGVNAVMEQLVW